jgi:hypothetical protein
MKKIKVFAAMGLCALLTGVVSADVIIPNTHSVTLCNKIVNTGEFPDVAVIQYLKPVLGGTGYRYFVNQDSCLKPGNKYLSNWLLWTTKHYADSVGLDSLPISQFISSLAKKTSSSAVLAISDLHLLSSTINTGYITVPDSSALMSEELFYKLYAGSSDIFVYLWKNISHFSNGTSTTDTFAQPTGVRPFQVKDVPKNSVDNIFLKNGIFTFKTTFNGTLEMTLIDCRGRIAGRYTRSCASGCTYVSDFARFKSGLYWLRLKSPNADVTRRVTIIR